MVILFSGLFYGLRFIISSLSVISRIIFMIVSLLFRFCSKNSIWSSTFLIKGPSSLSFGVWSFFSPCKFGPQQMILKRSFLHAYFQFQWLFALFDVCLGFEIWYYKECTISYQILKLLEFRLHSVLVYCQKNLIYKWWGLKWPLLTGEFYLHPAPIVIW